MTRETKNPAAGGTADGAQSGNLSKGKDTANRPAKQSNDTFTRDRLAWLEAVTDAPALPKAAYRVAAKLALRFLSRERGIAWPSVATLAKSLGTDRKAILAATAALEAAGFLAVVRSKGRGHANEYTLTIGPKKGGEITTFSDGEKGGETTTFSAPEKGGDFAREKVAFSPPHPFERNPLMGAGAHSARPSPFSNEVVLSSEDQSDADFYDGRAPDGAPVNDPGDMIPDHAADTENAAALFLGEAVTMADLDQIEAEERAAELADALEALPDPDPITQGAADLAALYGDALTAPDAMAADLFNGCAEGDPMAAARAARHVAAAMRRAGTNEAARPIWNGTREIVRRMVRDACGCDAAAADAVRALTEAVRLAGRAMTEQTEAQEEAAAHA